MNAHPLFATIVFAALALFAMPAVALTPAEQADVTKAETYLDQVRTLKAHFVQNAQDGSEARGTVYLDRPGKLRLEYDPPSPILVVAAGDTLVYYDSKLQQVSYVDLDSTMAGVLVRQQVKLDGDDLKVLSVAHEPGVVKITVTKRADAHIGRIMLVFTEKPFELRQWQVVDQQGAATVVTLYDTQTGLSLDADLFEFHDARTPTGAAQRH